jgi:hypothetical protein
MVSTRPWDPTTRELVKALFGRAARIAVAGWILEREGDAFYLAEAQIALAATSEAPSAVANEVNHFARLGLLAKVHVDRRTYFTRTDHPMWEALREVVRAADEVASQMGELSNGDTSRRT